MNRRRLRQIAGLVAMASIVGILCLATPLQAQEPQDFVQLWSSAQDIAALGLAWGDVDNDGDLDLAIGQQAVVYLNQHGTLQAEPAWRAPPMLSGETRDVAWSDLNGDGYLDLVVINRNALHQVYFNQQGTLALEAGWQSSEAGNEPRSALGDIDRDGDMDLLIAERTTSPKLAFYRNDAGQLTTQPVWTLPDLEGTIETLALGDFDQDADLDLAIGGSMGVVLYENRDARFTLIEHLSTLTNVFSLAWGQYGDDARPVLAIGRQNSLQVYPVTANGVEAQPIWSAQDARTAVHLMWGDYDGDGDSDLVAANADAAVRVYTQQADGLASVAAWESPEQGFFWRVAWGDIDSDGDLDLALGRIYGYPVLLYRNERPPFAADPVWESSNIYAVSTTAWGDYDNDGDLDLVVGDAFHPTGVHRNDAGVLTTAPVWSADTEDQTRTAAWGDYDNDGDLDLLLANANAPARLHENRAGVLSTEAVISLETGLTYSAAWGDYDGDGDLDLATGNHSSANRIYRNTGTGLEPDPVWQSQEHDNTYSIAWGDYDGDGDLDLATGSEGANRLYRNDNGVLTSAAVWTSAGYSRTATLAWGDYDNDGDLDLVAGTRISTDLDSKQPAGIYLHRNDAGRISRTAVWISASVGSIEQLVWGDYDGDGDLDLAVAGADSRLYRNERGVLATSPVWTVTDQPVSSSGVAWGDYDNDGDLDLLFTPQGGNVHLFANQRMHPSRGAPLGSLRWQNPPLDARATGYATDRWNTGAAVALAVQIPTGTCLDPNTLAGFYSLDQGGTWQPMVLSQPEASSPDGQYTVSWDTWASGVFGQSDDVMLRLQAQPARTGCGGQVALHQYGSAVTASLPFRMSSNRVQVLNGDQPVHDAVVYRLRQGQHRSEVLRSPTGQALTTDANGYLRGYSAVAPGDLLVALEPVTHTDTYTLYYTSAAPTPAGVAAHPVVERGTQTLRVSAAYPLILFNLDVGLEWDARRNVDYMANLRTRLQRAAELLYDWTDGQATLGNITVYHGRENWNDVHLRVYSTNRMRPSATQGGIVAASVRDPLKPDITYVPGQIRMGSVWDRYGAQQPDSPDDWAAALAHELGHYALFLNDNYFGFDDTGRFTFVDTCPGAMSDPYNVEDSEFPSPYDWLPDCQHTYSQQDTGRSDWETIGLFYPALQPPPTPLEQANSGPAMLPLDVVAIQEHAPTTQTETLETPIFSLVTPSNLRANASDKTQAFLIQDDYIVSLGYPDGDEVYAYDATAGDRLCATDPITQRSGCITIATGNENLPLHFDPAWQADMVITPVTSETIELRVTQIPAGLDLYARIYPINGEPSATVALAEADAAYTQIIKLTEPSFEGYVRVWVDEPDGVRPRREVIAEYTIAGNPGSRRRSHRTPENNPGSRRRSHRAPIMSSDGQVLLFNQQIDFPEGTFYTFQSVPRPPEPPPGRTVIGQAYRLTPSAQAPDLAGSTISFEYLGRDVPDGEEADLTIYFWDGRAWQQLATTRDTENNVASAALADHGLYALMSTIQVALPAAGWHQFAYTGRETQPLQYALRSIAGAYSLVVETDNTVPPNEWKVYAPAAPVWVNDLTALQPRAIYQIHATQPTTLYLSTSAPDLPEASPPQGATPMLASGFPEPPALYYGSLVATEELSPTAGVPVIARIGDTVCGRSSTRMEGGSVVYVIKVAAATAGEACGTLGAKVRLELEGAPLYRDAVWDNTRATLRDLRPAASQFILHLPLVASRR